MEKPEKPDEDASPAEIQEYLMEYEAWAQSQGAKKMGDENEGEEDTEE